MTKIEEWKAKVKKSEDKRVGDIYAECVKRGCDLRFIEAFDSRMWLYPEKQTKAFLGVSSKPNVENHLKQWKIFLQVILEKRPHHEKATEWKNSLELLKNT